MRANFFPLPCAVSCADLERKEEGGGKEMGMFQGGRGCEVVGEGMVMTDLSLYC